jgi:cation transport ATPase
MSLKDLAHQLADLAWSLEQQSQHPMDAAILGYVQDTVTVEVEYRRRMRDLERRLNDILESQVA